MKTKLLNVGIIGSGLQANRRLESVSNHSNSKVIAIAAINEFEKEKISKRTTARITNDWNTIVTDPEIDVIVVCTPPYLHFEICSKALALGKHVLCEKPLTMNSLDALKLTQLSAKNAVLFKCGFNHRHHPAMIKANLIVKSGLIGNPVSGRAVYGICGREGCENEWRSNPEFSAGGQLMEQGIHCIDLFRWMMGEFKYASANISTQIFDIAPFEDTAQAMLIMKNGVGVTIHSGITQWRNKFRFELYGTKGYIEINGLGGSYDLQKLHIGLRKPNEPFSEEIIDYRGGDKSWKNEWNHFMNAILNGVSLMGDGMDGAIASQIVESCYKSAKNKQYIEIVNYESE